MHVTAAPATASPAKGFDSLDDEVRVDSLPLTGELPDVAHRLAGPDRARRSSRSASGR